MGFNFKITLLLLFMPLFLTSDYVNAEDYFTYDQHPNTAKEQYKTNISPPSGIYEKQVNIGDEVSRRKQLELFNSENKKYISSQKVSDSSNQALKTSNIAMERKFLKDNNSLYSVVFDRTQPLEEVLYELANLANINLKLDPNIAGHIIYKAVDRPLMTIIDDICEMAGLRYTFDNNILSIKIDHSYAKTYEVDYINLIRETNSNISIDVSVVSGEEAEVGSKSQIGSISDNDFWLELETHVRSLLDSTNDIKTSSIVNNTGSFSSFNKDLPYNELEEEQEDDSNVLSDQPADVFVSKNSGLVTVFAKEHQHKVVAEYLDKLHRISTAQVLIESKILEVELFDEYASGINWQSLQGDGINIGNIGTFGVDLSRQVLSSLGPVNGVVATLESANNVQLAIEAISRFGTTRALSSPRVTVMNNQSAVLNVVENRVFFDLDVTVLPGEDGARDTITVDSNINSVPEGVLIKVIPSINLKSGEITLMLRPTVTRVVGSIADPGVAIALLSANSDNSSVLDDVNNLIPQLAVQEMDTVVKVHSGDIAVMGGLMQDRREKLENGVPVMKDIPIVGNLFKSNTDQLKKSELVVFIKATIINNDSVNSHDKTFYKNFSNALNPTQM